VAPENPDLVIAIIPKIDTELYAALKKLMCVKFALLSQVITAQRIINKFDKHRTFATKILVQMATKLGAKPWALKIPPKNVMIAGFDTFHSKDGDRHGTSYGAFTATLDPLFGRYYSQSLSHQAGEEISQNLPTMFVGALKEYQAVNGALPQKIIFYRDGVGEGQVEEVRDIEIKAIKACLPDANIKLTFIIVSKRINTRFFTTGKNKVGNPPSGTVVDDVATLPERYDFYLVSQSVREGTVNPTSYNIILDESGWGPDKIQMLTYKLTHLYYNWPGTVRVPAPCMYAHKLAKLIGESVRNHVNPSLTSKNVLYYL
jgi:aubergine-like protein